MHHRVARLTIVLFCLFVMLRTPLLARPIDGDAPESDASPLGFSCDNQTTYTLGTFCPQMARAGIACSTQSGTEAGKFQYRDSHAVLAGFPPDQEAWGQACIARPSSSCHQELEILLRFTSSPHFTTGYECFARCVDDGTSYVEIVRWDGPLGKFTYLARMHGRGFGLKHDDTLKASIVGNVITVFINGVKKAQVVDDTFKTGNPGIGEFLACDNGQGVGTNTASGFSNFTARRIRAGARVDPPR